MAEKKKKLTKKEEAALKKQVLAENADKIEKMAQKAALQAMTEVQLATQVELTEEQKDAAKLLATGYSVIEVADKTGIKRQEISAWLGLPSFVRAMNEATIKEGASDKNERIRNARRIYDEVYAAMMQRITSGDLSKMPIAVLDKMLLTWAARMDALVDKKDDKDATRKDLTVLILGHVQDKNGKKYDKIDDFLNDEEFKYPTIDTYAEVVDESGQTDEISD